MLTIGIPTYNRVAGVTQHARALITARVHEVARVLIIDNASTDGTFESLRGICDATDIRVLRNERNLGFRGNFLRLFQECDTDYLLVTSDEDPVIHAHLDPLVRFLEAHRPLFLSPQYYRREEPSTVFRGQMKARRIEPHEFLYCSAHMPGLVFRTRESNEVISDVRMHLENVDLEVYPQVLLAAGLILRGPCYWWDKPIVRQEYEFLRLHGDFNHLPQRWGHYKGFADFLMDRVEKAADPETRMIATRMVQHQQESLGFHFIRNAIGQERPDLLPGFDRGARAFYHRSIAREYARAASHPLASGRALLRKLTRSS